MSVWVCVGENASSMAVCLFDKCFDMNAIHYCSFTLHSHHSVSEIIDLWPSKKQSIQQYCSIIKMCTTIDVCQCVNDLRKSMYKYGYSHSVTLQCAILMNTCKIHFIIVARDSLCIYTYFVKRFKSDVTWVKEIQNINLHTIWFVCGFHLMSRHIFSSFPFCRLCSGPFIRLDLCFTVSCDCCSHTLTHTQQQFNTVFVITISRFLDAVFVPLQSLCCCVY